MAAPRVALTRPRKIATGGLGVIHLLLAYAYSNPALSITPPPPGQLRISIVGYINDLGPVWLIGFGLTGVGLIATLLLYHHALAWAHVAGVAVSATYTIALWAGFILSTPRPTIIASILSVAVMLWHISMSDLYSAGGVPRPRRRHAR